MAVNSNNIAPCWTHSPSTLPALLSDTSPVPCLSSPRDYSLEGSTQPTLLLGSIMITFLEALACLWGLSLCVVLGLRLQLPPILYLVIVHIRLQVLSQFAISSPQWSRVGRSGQEQLQCLDQVAESCRCQCQGWVVEKGIQNRCQPTSSSPTEGCYREYQWGVTLLAQTHLCKEQLTGRKGSLTQLCPVRLMVCLNQPHNSSCVTWCTFAMASLAQPVWPLCAYMCVVIGLNS